MIYSLQSLSEGGSWAQAVADTAASQLRHDQGKLLLLIFGGAAFSPTHAQGR